MTRRHSILDATAIGASLAIERGGEVLTYTAPCDINRSARHTDGKSAGIWRAAWRFWGNAPIANAVSVGVVRASASLSTYVGGDADGYGFRVAEGQIHHGGASIATVSAAAKGQWIGLVLDATDSGEVTLTWAIDGVDVHALTLPDVGPWYLATTLSGDYAFDLRAMINCGQRAFPWPAGGALGWYAVRESSGIVRLADFEHITRGTDDPPHVVFRPVVRNDSALSLRRGLLNFWPLRSGAGSIIASTGRLVVSNDDGAFDGLITNDVRGATARVLLLPDGADMSEAEPLGTLQLDAVNGPSDDVAEFVLTDALASELALPIQHRKLDPDVEESSADTVVPIVWGAARSVRPKLLWIDPKPTYQLNDGPISGLGAVRDGGWPLVPTADPPDYTVDQFGRLILEREPEWDITCDVDSVGTAYVPPSPTDALAGTCAPFVGTPFATPDDVTNLGAQDATLWGATLALPNVLGDLVIARLDGGELEAGKSYTIKFKIGQLQPAQIGMSTVPSKLSLCRTASRFTPVHTVTAGYLDGFGNPAFPDDLNPTRADVEISFLYSPATTHFLHVVYEPANFTGDAANLIRVTAIEHTPTAYVEEDDATPMLLEAFLRDVFERRCGWSSAAWSAPDAAAIDAITGAAGIGVAAVSDATRSSVLQPALDSYCAALYRDRFGVVRVARLRKPEDESPIGTITQAMLRGDLRVRPYQAPGLTTQATLRRNWHPLDKFKATEDDVEVTPDMRARLQADYRISIASAARLASAYAHAVGAPPQPFVFDRRVDGQRALDDVCEYHGVLRFFVEADVAWSIDYDYDQIWAIEAPRRWSTPRPMQLIGLDPNPIAGVVRLVFLG